MLKILKYLLITLAVVACLLFATCSYLANYVFTPEKMCGKTPGLELVAPNNELKAVIYEFNCGAMDPFITHVSILSVDEVIPHEGGNVFASSRGERRGAWRGPYAEIEWVTPEHLLVRYIRDTDIHFKNATVKGVQISYEALP